MTAAVLPEHVATPPPDMLTIQHAIDTLLDHAPKPAAIITGSDVLAAAVYAAAARPQRRIGDDLAVTGFDGSAVGRLLIPTLTTLAIPAAR
jgi:DNA-binding LacI/PurR family transcriptional regulator